MSVCAAMRAAAVVSVVGAKRGQYRAVSAVAVCGVPSWRMLPLPFLVSVGSWRRFLWWCVRGRVRKNFRELGRTCGRGSWNAYGMPGVMSVRAECVGLTCCRWCGCVAVFWWQRWNVCRLPLSGYEACNVCTLSSCERGGGVCNKYVRMTCPTLWRTCQNHTEEGRHGYTS